MREIGLFPMLDETPQAYHFLPEDRPQAPELTGDIGRLPNHLKTHRGQLSLNPQDRLNDPVVEFAREARALDGCGAGAQSAEPLVSAWHYNTPLSVSTAQAEQYSGQWVYRAETA
jgi:hypothetical protein